MSFGHGGYRPGSGRPKASLEKRILEGTVKMSELESKRIEKTKEEISKITTVNAEEVSNVDNASNLTDVEEKDMPKVEDYLKARERNGKPLGADYEFKKLWSWLKKMGCEKLVNPKLIELYSMNAARYRQCHEMLSDIGLLVKNAQGNPIASPYAVMAMNFEKAMNNELMIMNQIVKDNASNITINMTPEDYEMEKLLSK